MEVPKIREIHKIYKRVLGMIFVAVISYAYFYIIGEDSENWCFGRSQDTPSELIEVQQPTDQTHDFDQDGDTNRRGGFSVLQPVSAATLFLIVMLVKLML